jgi:antitoxin ParD1/3/4
MAMIKKSITVTPHQNDWIKAKLQSGHFGHESEIIRELIRERELSEQETLGEIEAIREALIKGEKSGFTNTSVEEIWAEARAQKRHV